MSTHNDSTSTQDVQTLVKKILTLTPQRVSEVEAFVDFLRQREQQLSLTRSVSKLSEPVLNQIWDNPEDAEYDQL